MCREICEGEYWNMCVRVCVRVCVCVRVSMIANVRVSEGDSQSVCMSVSSGGRATDTLDHSDENYAHDNRLGKKE